MAVAEGKLALETGKAGLTLLTSLVSLIKAAQEQGEDVDFAEIMARMPAEVFALSKELLREVEKLKQDFLDSNVPLDKSIDQLQSEFGWWRFGKHRLFRKFEGRANGISDSLGHFLDDFLSVANCAGTEKDVAKSFAESRGRQHDLSPAISSKNE